MGQRLFAWTAAAAALATASCAIIASLGDRTLGPIDDDGGALDGALPDGTIPPGDDGATPPGDGGNPSDVVTPPFDAPPGCVVETNPASLSEAQIYLAVDTSGSMVDVLPEAGVGVTRISAERAAVSAFVKDPLSASLYVAMDTHPAQGADAGCAGTAYAAPPVPLGKLGAGTAATIDAYLAPLAPLGNSPWSAMLTGALEFAKAAQQSAPARQTAFVFMADSTPTACLMTAPELTAIVAPYAQATPPVRTFFVGITLVPGDVTTFMDPIAQAGGTGAAFAKVPPTEATMLAALESIRDDVACVMKLPLVGGKPADLSKGLLFLQTAGGQVSTSAVANAAACTAAADAWFPDPLGDRVHLCPKTCNRLLGDATVRGFVAACRP